MPIERTRALITAVCGFNQSLELIQSLFNQTPLKSPSIAIQEKALSLKPEKNDEGAIIEIYQKLIKLAKEGKAILCLQVSLQKQHSHFSEFEKEINQLGDLFLYHYQKKNAVWQYFNESDAGREALSYFLFILQGSSKAELYVSLLKKMHQTIRGLPDAPHSLVQVLEWLSFAVNNNVKPEVDNPFIQLEYALQHSSNEERLQALSDYLTAPFDFKHLPFPYAFWVKSTFSLQILHSLIEHDIDSIHLEQLLILVKRSKNTVDFPDITPQDNLAYYLTSMFAHVSPSLNAFYNAFGRYFKESIYLDLIGNISKLHARFVLQYNILHLLSGKVYFDSAAMLISFADDVLKYSEHYKAEQREKIWLILINDLGFRLERFPKEFERLLIEKMVYIAEMCLKYSRYAHLLLILKKLDLEDTPQHRAYNHVACCFDYITGLYSRTNIEELFSYIEENEAKLKQYSSPLSHDFNLVFESSENRKKIANVFLDTLRDKLPHFDLKNLTDQQYKMVQKLRNHVEKILGLLDPGYDKRVIVQLFLDDFWYKKNMACLESMDEKKPVAISTTKSRSRKKRVSRCEDEKSFSPSSPEVGFFQSDPTLIKSTQLPRELLDFVHLLHEQTSSLMVLTGGAVLNLYLKALGAMSPSEPIRDWDCKLADVNLYELKKRLIELGFEESKVVGQKHPVLTVTIGDKDNPITIDISAYNGLQDALGKGLKHALNKHDFKALALYMVFLPEKKEHYRIKGFDSALNSVNRRVIAPVGHKSYKPRDDFFNDVTRLFRLAKLQLVAPVLTIDEPLLQLLNALNMKTAIHDYCEKCSQNRGRIGTALEQNLSRFGMKVYLAKLDELGILAGLTHLNALQRQHMLDSMPAVWDEAYLDGYHKKLLFYASVIAELCIMLKAQQQEVCIGDESKEDETPCLNAFPFYQFAMQNIKRLHWPYIWYIEKELVGSDEDVVVGDENITYIIKNAKLQLESEKASGGLTQAV